MRGIGVGIILATLILFMANPREKLSDEEIIRRASALGMTMKEDDNPALDKLIDEIKPSITMTPTLTPTPEAEISPTPIAEITPAPETGISPSPAAEISPESVSIPAEESDKKAQPDIKEDNQPVKITFQIEEGMSSQKVADLLEKKGLIDDAKDFNNYIIEQGKAHILRTGNYTLPLTSSYDEILNAITK